MDKLYKGNPFQRFELNNGRIEEFEEERGIYTISQKIGANCMSLVDNEIVKAVVEAAREEGITDLILMDKDFVLRALKNELDRWYKENENGNCEEV